jgi:peptidoglycan/LPS O-acetylase OafA/YrhL
LVAVMCVAMITLIASSSSDGHRLFGLSARTTRILESRPLTSVGQFSYSLYLTHLAVLAILGITLNLSPVKQLGVFSIAPLPIRILVVIPILLISAYGFYLLFEKPFLNKRK